MAKKHEDPAGQNEDENITPDPVYHESDNYVSAYFGEVPEYIKPVQKQDKSLQSTVIALVTDPRNREHRQEVLNTLKNNNARELLITLLQDKDYRKYRKDILAVCWETGIDFSADLDFFTGFLFDPDPQIVLEANTVIEEMPGPFSPDIQARVLEKLASFPEDHVFYPLISTIRQRIS
jgi:hypothetical protein